MGIYLGRGRGAEPKLEALCHCFLVRNPAGRIVGRLFEKGAHGDRVFTHNPTTPNSEAKEKQHQARLPILGFKKF